MSNKKTTDISVRTGPRFKWAQKAVGDVETRYKKARKHLNEKMKTAQKKERSRPILAQALTPGTEMTKIMGQQKRAKKEAVRQAKQDVNLIKDYGVGEENPRSDARKSKSFMSHKATKAKGGTIRLKTGGHVVDSYDY